MPIRPERIAEASAVQHTAAHDESKTVRLVAGPGTGKSASIEERVSWLLRNGVEPKNIHAVSFTRASAADLKYRCHLQATKDGHEDGADVWVSTLHSMALRLLKMANLLSAYPTKPLVLDNWEVENIFDEEFAHLNSPMRKKRREEIRRWHEAFWSTGTWGPPNYIPPDPAISPDETDRFTRFHKPRTQTYACVLPGEIIGLCVESMEAGLLNAVKLLGIEHLIVDEYQDLNPIDQRFVGHIIKQGATVFIAGDDDQSLYSFRFASPSGIQTFTADYPGTGDHNLRHCFRCPPTILGASTTLIGANPSPGRIAKVHVSLYGDANPIVSGNVHAWRFPHADPEAEAIAISCKSLIERGVNPREIMILLSNQRSLGSSIITALEYHSVEAEHPREESFLNTEGGRLVLAILRIVCNSEDYVAHRVLLGLRNKVGIGTCAAVCDAVIANNLNFRSIFYDTIAANSIKGRALTAVNGARATCAAITGWSKEDTLQARKDAIRELVVSHLGDADANAWSAYIKDLPEKVTLEELRDVLWADTDEQQGTVLQAAMERLELPIPEQGPLPPRVRVMTMHGAKGLSARVVFIPGLEEEIIPGQWRRPYPGLVLEAARMLYVSITRARAACILSFSELRMINGNTDQMTPSRFARNLGVAFADRSDGLNKAEVEEIIGHCKHL